MTIHKGNIEAYLLDYLEGNLDALLTAELMAFLSENPAYEKWLPEYDGHICLETGPVFKDKHSLKKDFRDVPLIHEHNFDEFCIASAEGLLVEKDQGRLDEYLAMHPEKQYDFRVYGQLKMQADYLLVYPDKRDLKKREPVVIPLRFLYYAIAIAASVALLFMLVSRKPAEQVFTASVPDKSTMDSKQIKEAVPENQVPVVTSAASTPGPAVDKVIKEAVPRKDISVETVNKPGLQPMTAIEPIHPARITSGNAKPGIQRVTPPAAKTVYYADSPEEVPPETPAHILGSLVKKLNLWKAAETAVTGFNYLTESRLSLVKTTDETGKFSSFSLESEDYDLSDNKVK